MVVRAVTARFRPEIRSGARNQTNSRHPDVEVITVRIS
jgi:hypothetical protein